MIGYATINQQRYKPGRSCVVRSLFLALLQQTGPAATKLQQLQKDIVTLQTKRGKLISFMFNLADSVKSAGAAQRISSTEDLSTWSSTLFPLTTGGFCTSSLTAIPAWHWQ